MCDKCKKNNCGCDKIEFCGCKTKLDLLCSTYTGELLETLDIKTGTDGNTVIKTINDYLEDMDEPNPVIIENVGTGLGLFKEFSEEYKQEFKSIIAGQGIILTEQTDSITASIDPDLVIKNSDLTLEQARLNGNVLEGDIKISNYSEFSGIKNVVNDVTNFVGFSDDGIVQMKKSKVNGDTSYIGISGSSVEISSSSPEFIGILGDQEFNKQGDRKAFAQISDIKDALENVATIDKDGMLGNTYSKEQIDEREAMDLQGYLKISDPKPTLVGKYGLLVGTYTNLVPIIPYGSSTPTNTPITTVDGFYNAVYWDGVNFIQIKTEMPKPPITTEFKTVDTTEFVEDSEFDIDWVKGGFISLSAQQVQANLSYMYAERIDLLQNTEIYVSGVFGVENGILIYDSKGAVLKRIDSTVTGNQDSQTLNFKIDIPKGGSYMSFSTIIDGVNKVVGRYYKRITKDFDDFYREFSKSITLETNDKAFEKINAVWNAGFYYNIYTTDNILEVGTKVPDPTFQYTTVSVEGITAIKVSFILGINQGILCYNSNGQIIKVIGHTAINSALPIGSQLIDEIIYLPEGTATVTIDSRIGAITSIESVTSRNRVSRKTIKDIYDQGLVVGGFENIFNEIDWFQGEKILNTDGSIISDIAWKRSEFIAVKKGDRFKVKLRGDLNSPIVAFYTTESFGSFSKNLANFLDSQLASNVETEIVIEKKGFVVFQTRTYEYFIDDLYLKKYNKDYFYYNSVADLKAELVKIGLFKNVVKDPVNIEKPTEIYLTGEMPKDASDIRTPTQLHFSMQKNGIEILNGFTNLSIQGHGSAVYLKKGYTFDVLNNVGEEMKIKFGDMVSADSFHLKAYATDPTHTRDIGSARIWRDMINFLDYPQSKVNNMGIGLSLTTNENEAYNQDAKYHTEGFPVRVFLNGVFYGIFTMRNKKTRENYSLNNKNLKHIYLDSVTYTAFLTDPFRYIDWEVKSPKMTGYGGEGAPIPANYNSNVLASINNLFNFTSNLAVNFADHGNVIVLNHWIVWIIFSEVISNRDTDGNNYNLITWDGVHWSILPYDMDLTLGLNPWEGGYTVELSRKQFDINHDIWLPFKTVYANEIKAMYTKLRNNGFLTVSNLSKYYQGIAENISREDYKNDATIWGNIWTNSVTTVEQIELFLKNKLDYLDTKWL